MFEAQWDEVKDWEQADKQAEQNVTTQIIISPVLNC